MAIVGASTFGVAIAEQLMVTKHEGLDVIGFLDEYVPLGQPLLGKLTVIGRPSDLPRLVQEDVADEYVLVPHALPHQRLEELTRLVVLQDRLIIRSAVSTIDLLTNGVLIAERGRVPLVTLRRARITGLEAVLKRAFDVVGAVVALIALAPLALVLVARAALVGNRPILQHQLVYGVGGSPTSLWIFEPGVTSWLFVRGVPALFGVLRGQLSLVGPRPLNYVGQDGVPSDLRLTTVKPGLSGPWRLGGVGASLADQALGDLTYVRNYSIWADLHILWESARRIGLRQTRTTLGRWHPLAVGRQPAEELEARSEAPLAWLAALSGPGHVTTSTEWYQDDPKGDVKVSNVNASNISVGSTRG